MEPLPLQDAPPLRPRRRLWPKLVFVFVCLLLALGTFAGMRYRAGAVPDFAYAEFHNDSCKLLMIGHPLSVGHETFTMHASGHWSTPLSTELRVYDIEPGKEVLIRPEDLFAEHIQQRAKQLDAKVEKEGAVKWNEYLGREAVFVNGRSRWVERYLFVTKPGQPRLYVLSIGGSGMTPDADAVAKVFHSFRLN